MKRIIEMEQHKPLYINVYRLKNVAKGAQFQGVTLLWLIAP